MEHTVQEILDGMKIWIATRNDLTEAGKLVLRSMIAQLEPLDPYNSELMLKDQLVKLTEQNRRLVNGLLRITNVNDEAILKDTSSVLVAVNLFKHIARETLDPERL